MAKSYISELRTVRSDLYSVLFLACVLMFALRFESIFYFLGTQLLFNRVFQVIFVGYPFFPESKFYRILRLSSVLSTDIFTAHRCRIRGALPICNEQFIMLKMAKQERSDFYVVFTVILCVANFTPFGTS